jgi:hypothetical protein
MFCPECKGEFMPGVLTCSACGVALVEDLAAGDAAGPLAPLTGSLHPDDLMELVDRLEKASVPYVVQAGTALGLLDDPERELEAPEAWEARVWVASALAERAARILREVLGETRGGE